MKNFLKPTINTEVRKFSPHFFTASSNDNHTANTGDNGVFPKWSRTFTEFSKFREHDNHWAWIGINLKDPLSYMCLAGLVVASWCLIKQVAGSRPFTVIVAVKTSINLTIPQTCNILLRISSLNGHNCLTRKCLQLYSRLKLRKCLLPFLHCTGWLQWCSHRETHRVSLWSNYWLFVLLLYGTQRR